MTQRKSGAEGNIDDGANNVKAGAKPMGKRITDPDRDVETEYNVQKVKE